jgi:hypothetical protein
MRIPSESTDRYLYFVAVDSTDLKTRETGLSSFTVYRSRNGGTAAAFTTPTVNETSSGNLPGVYELLIDEDTTLDAGHDVEEMVFHITQADMAPVTRVVELYRPETTEGNTATVASDGDLAKVNTLDGHTAQTADHTSGISAIPTTAMRGTDSAALASVATEARLAELDSANIPADIAAIPTTAMRGTDSAALASVATEARLAELDAANLPADVAAIPTTAMRGTDSAALASVATEARLAELDAANMPADIAAIPTTAMRGTDSAATATALATAQTDLTQIKADLPSRITKATALANFPFLMITASDDVTPMTGLSVTATRSIDGAAFGSCANAVTEVSNGWYKISLDAADLNGDTIALRFTAASANDTNISLVTQP